MNILDVFRQLYLLLWKNYVLRSRAKIRLIIEILWPLILFLILMWVRTRGLRNNEPNCFFVERPLPSAGIIPFVQGLICNLNHSCYETTQNSYQNTEFFQFLNLTSDTLEFFNQPQVIQNALTIARFINSSMRIRSESSEITKALNLSQSLRISEQQFKNALNISSLYPSPLNETIFDKILNSTPNYNYLYSNYSKDSTEPIDFLNFGQLDQVRPLLNFFYGPDLELAELNRDNNRVDNPSWIRSQTCNGSNYLLKGPNALYLKQIICRLDDQQISQLFIQISTYLDIGKIKRLVYEETDLSDPRLLEELIDVGVAYLNLTGEFQNSDLPNYQFESFQDAFNNFTQIGLSNANTLSDLLNNNSTNLDFLDDSDKFFDRQLKKPSSRQTNSNEETLNFDNLNSTTDLDFATELLNRFNNLNRIDPKKCPINRTEADLDPSTQFLVNSTTKTCFCQSIYAVINGISEGSQFLFRQIKPMFLGKVLYAPNTPVYQELVKKINQTFSRIDGIVSTLGTTAELSDQLLYQLNQINKSLSQTNGSFNPETNTAGLSNQIGNQLNQINQILSQINGSSAIVDDLTGLTNQILNQLNQINQTTLAFNSIVVNLLNFTPQIRFTSALLYFIRNSLQCIEVNKFVGFATEQELVSTGLKLIDKESFWAGLVFVNDEQNSQLPKIVKYKIRMNAALTHDTSYTQDKLYYYGPSNCLGCNAYFTYGFIYLQDMIEKAIVEMKTEQVQDMGIIGQMTPYPCFIDDKFLNAISRTLPLFMVLAWIYTVSMLVKDIVYEKEKRLKEFMRVMSLSNGIHWISWFITSFSLMFLIVLILCIVLKFGDILPNSDFGTLLVFFICFTLATICQCFLISVFFNQANLAAVVAGIIYFLLYLPYTVLINYSDEILPWQKFLASLSSTVAFSYGCEILAAYEKQNVGVNWENFYKTPYTNDDPFNMNYLSLILLMDALIYMLLTWYIEGIAPGEFGVARKWYFPVQPSYWCGESTKKKDKSKLKKLTDKLTDKITFLKTKKKDKIIKIDEENYKDDKIKKLLEESVEPVDEQILPGVQIEKLHKVYSRGNNHALKGLSVNFYKNEISAFLGHNGAGKSTTMHLLTGLYSPTSGSALIEGLDITESMDSVRKSLGFVPQHNVLFPQLTVKEHLWFFARLKGLDTKLTKKELEKMLDDTGLRPKKNELSKNLSGGMQRKLSVAVAFVGGSKTVILDEPSAGVDPAGRRSIWDLLFKYREGRTIIISTHHMDEADVLGDRIAIISNGRLIAHGTSYFLKQKFGQGYYLTFSKRKLANDQVQLEPNRSSTGSSNSTDSGARSMYSFNTDQVSSDRTRRSSADFLNQNEEIDLENFEKELLEKEEKLINSLETVQDTNLCRFVKNRIQNAILIENIGSEMTFSISNKSEFTKTYENFFQQVESNMKTLGIDSIGLSDTTLEEIFIKLAKEPKSNDFKLEKKFCGINFSRIRTKIKNFSLFKSADKANQTLTPEVLEKYSDYTMKRVESSLLASGQQLYALLIKRFHRLKRNIKGFFAEIVLPVVFVCLALLVATLTPNQSDRPPLELHPWYYRTPNLMFLSRSSSFEYDRTFYNENGQSNSVIDSSVQPNIDQINQIIEALMNNPGAGNRCMKGHRIPTQKSAYQNKIADQFLQCEDFDDYQTFMNSTPSYSFINELLSTNYSFTKRSKDCDCSQGFPECPASAGGDIFYRNFYKLKTKDIVYNLTGRNISDWLIKTELNKNIFQRRYGGYEFLVPRIGLNSEQISNFLNNLISINSQLNAQDNSTFFTSSSLTSINNVKLWYNTKGYDANVAYLNVLNNAFMRSKLTEKNIDATEHGIVAINHPMSFTRNQFIEQLERRIMIDLFVAICIIFALSFIPASFLVFILEERANNSKQLQFVSGVKPYVYWISNFVWDLVNYIIPTCLCIIIFAIFGVKAYMSKENAPCLIALMLLYGWACIPLMYPLNYLFKIPSTAFVISSSLNVFIGVVTTMTTTVLSQLGEDDKELKEINKILKPIFIVLFPHYCLGQGFIEMAELYTVSEVKKNFGLKGEYDPFEFKNVGRNLLALSIQGFVFFVLNLLVQYKFFIRFKPVQNLEKLNLAEDNEPEDEDVRTERKRILDNVKNEKYMNKIRFKRLKKMVKKDLNVDKKKIDEKTNEDFVRLVNLTKIYKKWKKYRFKKHTAVKDLCIGLNKGECFGLIGVNGAGKTTSFKMITGEISISGGDVYVNNYSVSRQIEKVHQNIGYCPQTDAIFPLLTAREHLIFFARLRGIPEKYVKQVSEWAMYRVGLTVFADRISKDFSGGNKRKLSTAIALVGNPSVICLDEPTSGMDAKARRLLWNDIISLIKENRLVILTSHSMEECEALCTRLVIMVNGQFKCLGSPQHLKAKFGNGFKLSIRLNDANDKRKLQEFMKNKFPQSKIQETHRNLYEYVLPFNHTKLSAIFGQIESNRESLGLKDYSVSQTTLDQVFINFAKQQYDSDFIELNQIENEIDISVEQNNSMLAINDTESNFNENSQELAQLDSNNNKNEKPNESDQEIKDEKEEEFEESVNILPKTDENINNGDIVHITKL
uniref:ATP-binding cassette transporter subfamily A member 1-like X1 protein n=1 Tax=Brachionus koreanus TaxID=1199090 RepID=A0A1J0MMU6_9BILA|nr:ATP-binding cassette transporter subfamily A member 1-like X1 protein [Brachionus koreanus]